MDIDESRPINKLLNPTMCHSRHGVMWRSRAQAWRNRDLPVDTRSAGYVSGSRGNMSAALQKSNLNLNATVLMADDSARRGTRGGGGRQNPMMKNVTQLRSARCGRSHLLMVPHRAGKRDGQTISRWSESGVGLRRGRGRARADGVKGKEN